MQRRHALHSSWPAGSFDPDFTSYFPCYQRLPLSNVQGLAGKGRLHTIDYDIALIVRQPSPPLAPGTQRMVGRTACWLNDTPSALMCTCSCAPGSCRLAIPQVLAAWKPRASYVFSNDSTGGSVCLSASGDNYASAWRVKHGNLDGKRSGGPSSRYPCQKCPASPSAWTTSALYRSCLQVINT